MILIPFWEERACHSVLLWNTWLYNSALKQVPEIFQPLQWWSGQGVLLRLADREGFVCIRRSASAWSTWLCSCCSSEAFQWRLCYLQSQSPPQTCLQPKKKKKKTWTDLKKRADWCENKLRLRLWVGFCIWHDDNLPNHKKQVWSRLCHF